MKKILTFGIILCLASSLFAKPTFDKKKALKDEGKKEFTATSAIETVKNMKTGWNLGNTFDAPGKTVRAETAWGQPKTTKAMIDGLAASGMKTIRLPVSWSDHIIDQKYTIDPEWMARVKEVVDCAISNDMYVIINSHHDNFDKPSKMGYGKGYYPNSVNYEESAKFLENIWAQICLAFNNGYDEHLIFETMNEPRLRGTNYEWWNDLNSAEYKEASATLNKLNQLVLDTIRKSKGNNQKRFVMCPGLRAAPDSVLAKEFEMPKDDAPGKLIVSVHMYDPYGFAMLSPGESEFLPKHQNAIARTFKALKEKFILNGYAVVIGEYGAVNKENTPERVKWFSAFIKYSRFHGMTSCLWDNGDYRITKTSADKYSEKFGFYDRRKQVWFFPEILEAIMTNVGE